MILRILRHLRLPEDLPAMRPARDPPLPLDRQYAYTITWLEVQ